MVLLEIGYVVSSVYDRAECKLVGDAPMTKNSHGYRSRTRGLMSKSVRKRGISPLSSVLRNYETGQRVDIVIDPGFHKGMPHKRYHGRTGMVTGTRGRAVLVDVSIGHAVRQLIIRPEHLRPNRG